MEGKRSILKFGRRESEEHHENLLLSGKKPEYGPPK
jgi:hypothetical protein